MVALPEIPQEVIDELKASEGFRTHAYLCPAGKPTIGYGSTYYEDGKPVALTDPPITSARADGLLRVSIDKLVREMSKSIKETPTPQQLGAMVMLAYNIGLGSFRKSTVLRRFNSHDSRGAADAFLMWNKMRDTRTGKLVVSDGLNARRTKERALFLKGSLDIPVPTRAPDILPQIVVANEPKPVIKSRRLWSMITSGVSLCGGLVMTTLEAISNQVDRLNALQSQHAAFKVAFMIASACAIAYAIIRHIRDKREEEERA